MAPHDRFRRRGAFVINCFLFRWLGGTWPRCVSNKPSAHRVYFSPVLRTLLGALTKRATLPFLNFAFTSE